MILRRIARVIVDAYNDYHGGDEKHENRSQRPALPTFSGKKMEKAHLTSWDTVLPVSNADRTDSALPLSNAERAQGLVNRTIARVAGHQSEGADGR